MSTPCRPESVWSQEFAAHVACPLAEVIRTVVVLVQEHVTWSNWPTPAGGATMTLGTDVYPEPPAATVKPVTAPPLIVAVAVAPEPPPPLIVTTGAELYPRPPYCSVIEPTAPEVSTATPAAVPGVAPGSRKSVDRNAA